MNKNEVARLAKVSDEFAYLIINGKLNPFTNKGRQVVDFASKLYAEECRLEYIKEIIRMYHLNKTLEKRKKHGEKKGRK